MIMVLSMKTMMIDLWKEEKHNTLWNSIRHKYAIASTDIYESSDDKEQQFQQRKDIS